MVGGYPHAGAGLGVNQGRGWEGAAGLSGQAAQKEKSCRDARLAQ